MSSFTQSSGEKSPSTPTPKHSYKEEDEDPEPSSDIDEEVEVVEGEEDASADPSPAVSAKAAPLRIELQPSDFYFGATLGEGAFARVVHAKSKKTDTEFAIKIMEKIHIKRENKVKHVLMERKVLTMVSHPFIIKFHFSFQDQGYLYMCMDLAPGGILLDLINDQMNTYLEEGLQDKACDFLTAQFYSAEIIEALDYLHGMGIIHRDLKPENVLIDRAGHIKLGDFGTSTICTDSQSPRTSFVGTQDYVSPEVLAGDRKATKACDLWAVGCIIFQLFTGRSPFHGATEYLTFELIMGHCKNNKPLQYPESIPMAAQDLIQLMLIPNEDERLGSGEGDVNGYPVLKRHAFFDNIVWEQLADSKPPYKPDPSKFPDPNNMRDGAEDDWLLEGEPTPITPYHPVSELNQHDPHSNVASGEQRLSQFLKGDEKLVFTSIIYKRKGLFSKRRQLILTDTPRLIYFDPESMELKGEIPWTKSQPVSCTKKNSKEFDVKCSISQRTYHLTDNEAGAQVWIDKINHQLEKRQSQR